MMTYNEIINIDMHAGTDISSACDSAKRLAKERNAMVKFSFNGVDMVVYSWSGLDMLKDEYYTKLNKKHLEEDRRNLIDKIMQGSVSEGMRPSMVKLDDLKPIIKKIKENINNLQYRQDIMLPESGREEVIKIIDKNIGNL